jgi:division protein CdvB (Snf7/Vps24/ESCRT-III family)
MSGRFVDDWSKHDKPSLAERIRNEIKPTPLRERVSKTVYRLGTVQKKLDESHSNMERKYKTMFNKCVRAQEMKDNLTSTMYANECAQVKKMIQTIVSSQLALEQVTLRLQTVKDFGDIATEMMPTAKVVRSVQGSLAGVIPEVSYTLGTIGQTLDGLVMEVGEATGHGWNVSSSGEEAERILAEASAVAEHKIEGKFPKLTPIEASERGVNPH